MNSTNSLMVDLRGEALPLKNDANKIAQQLLRATPESFSKEECKKLEQLGLEVKLEITDGKTIFLVPKHTNKSRIELTFETLRSIVLCLSAFPGSTVDGVIQSQKKSG
jgi:hypothetical protein